LSNIKSLHRYIDRHLRFIRGAVASLREDLAFSDKNFKELLQALEETLRWLKEDPERH
jgi:ferric-dicitrate binding protein FerR (iron transport regulator)